MLSIVSFEFGFLQLKVNSFGLVCMHLFISVTLFALPTKARILCLDSYYRIE